MTEHTWVNKPGATIPGWLVPHMVGHLQPNGTFLISTPCGKARAQARVLVGNVVIERQGRVWTRTPEEAPAFIAGLHEEDLTIAAQTNIGPGKACQAGIKGPGVQPTKAQRLAVQTQALTAAGTPRTMAYPPPLGARPSIEWIFTNDLSVDETYQRRTDNEASRRLIASIAAKFDWRLFGVLTVSRRPDGSMKVIDGQHRWTGASMRGDIDQVPCCLSRFETPEEEAKLFIVANRARKPMNRLDDFHAALAAADDDALEILRLVIEAGLKVARNTSSSAWEPGEIAFTAAIARSLRLHGPAIVSAALTNIAEAFPGQKLTHGGSIFNGLVRILAHPPADFDPDRMFRALLAFDADGWGSFMAGLKGGDTRGQAMRQAMLEAYADTAPDAPGDAGREQGS
jgi:hypothetical protein